MEEKKKHLIKISFRMTQTEFQRIRQTVGCEFTISETIRRLIAKGLASDDNRDVPKPNIGQDLARGIEQEIRHIGTNVNQLARRLNTIMKRQETMSNSTIKMMISGLEMTVQHLDDINKRIQELSDN